MGAGRGGDGEGNARYLLPITWIFEKKKKKQN
jgi:hypothetical protein